MFDALEEIVKARQARGLDNWKRLDHLKEKLVGKHASQITFTTCYPGQEGTKKRLGSTSGNLHFLLGYVSPGFYVAPYHWSLVDPNMSDEEIAKKKHPANPRYWKESGLELEDEGDFDLGSPHPAASKSRTTKARAAERKTGAMKVRSGYGNYVAVPQDQTVYSLSNGHVYRWSVVKESFFAATNPDVSEIMNAEEGDEGPTEKGLRGVREPFDDFVYPMVRRHFPKPGSVFPVGSLTVLVKSDRIVFFDNGAPAYIKVFDRVYDSFDLKKGGDIHPSVLLQFATNYLGVNKQDLMQFVHNEELPAGSPTPGFEDIEGEYSRDVVVDGNTTRVVPRSVGG